MYSEVFFSNFTHLKVEFSVSGALFVVLNPAPNLKMLGLLQVKKTRVTSALHYLLEQVVNLIMLCMLLILTTGFCCWAYAEHLLSRLGTQCD
jgi:hypothetical protein